jgi:exoribonuclease R
LQQSIFKDIDQALVKKEPLGQSEDAILEAYNRAVLDRSTQRGVINRRAKLKLRTFDGDQGWCVWTGEHNDSKQAPSGHNKSEPQSGPVVQCILQQVTHRFCIAKPLKPSRKEIHIQGVENRRGAFDSATVKVEVLQESEEHDYGKVIKVVKQGEDCKQFICRVDPYNSIFFFPVDKKSPKIVNLPPISRGLVELESGIEPKSGYIQELKVHDVICFDPSSVEADNVPKVRESIPMKIAQNLLFIVWPLKWNKERRYPLGVVVGVLPRGDSMFHAERLLKLKYHVEELTESYDDGTDGVPEVADKVDWDSAITIDPEDAFNLDDALTLKCVSIAENGDQLFEFGVHIANVAKNLPLEHSLDKLVRRRITSIYGSCQGKNSYQPMLPHSYSKNVSLNQYTSRYCVSVLARALLKYGSTTMEIVGNESCEIKEGVVHSGLQLTYHEAEDILSQSEGCVSDVMRQRLADYQQRYPGRIPVEGQLKYLWRISTSLRKSRLGEKGGVYFATDAETAQSPVAHGLVEEMMIWANSKVAHKLIHSSLPNIVLRIQPFPNVKELEAFQKDFASIIQSNIQFAGIQCDAEVKQDSFVMLLDVWTEVVELLKQGKYGPARTMLTSTYLHPQLAVVGANLAKIQSKSAYHVKGEGRHRTGPDSENLKHYSLNTEYTHFTSPLRRAVDIVVQRLLQEALKANPPSSSSVYTSDELKDIIQSCNVKTRQANCFDNDLKVLDNALFNSRSSSCVTAYVAAITEGKIELYFQDMRLRHIPFWEKCIRTSLLMSQASEDQNLSAPVDDSDGMKSTWRLHFTTDDDSLSSLCGKNFSSVNFASKGYSPDTNRQSLLQYYVHRGNKDGTLGKHRAVCDHFPTTVEVSPKCWAEVQKFILTPNDRSAHDALRILTGCAQIEGTDRKENCSNKCFKETVKEDNVASTSDEDGSDVSIDTRTSGDTDDSSDDTHHNYQSGIDSGSDDGSGDGYDGTDDNLQENSTQSNSFDCQQVIDKSIFCSLEIPVEIREFKTVKVWLRAKYSEYILTPSIQMLDLAPHLQICIQHLTTPATCFAPTLLKQASKPHYNTVKEYVELWEDVFLAEAVSTSVRSTKSSLRMTMVKNIRIRWPALTIPSNAIGEPYYVPTGPLHIELSKIFCAEKLEFFPFNVGTLICARYCIPLQDDEMKILEDLYHLKYETKQDGKTAIEKLLGDNIDGHVRAVYHMVVTKIEEEGPASEGQEQLEQKVGRDRKMKPLKVKTGPIKVSLEMKGENNQRVSDVMQSLLANKSYPCDVQLLPLNTPHHRVYNSLRHLPSLSAKESSTIDVLLGKDHHLPKTDGKAIEKFFTHNKDVFEMWGTKKSLNQLQQKALKQGMKNRFQLIQGPPGTGKSVTGAHLAYAFALWNRQRRVKNSERIPCVVYCGPSNKSVEVVLRLLQPVAKEVNILRIYGRMIEKKDYRSPLSTAFTGESATDHKCPEDLAQYALHHKVHKESEQKEQIADLEKKFEELRNKGFIPSAEDRMKYENCILAAEASVIADGNYDIVLCTCNECFSPRFRQYIQPVQVIIDEAAMAMEPECLAPVCQAEHVVLIGDHKQLQPIIDNHNAKENGLGVSLFERLAPTDEDTSSPVPFISLNVQYRMHKAVCSFPSECFYDEKLVPHESARERSLPRLKSFWPNDKWPIAFYDVVKGHEDGSTGRRKISKDSKSNTVEAKKVVDIVSNLLGEYGVEASDVAVLTPYMAQKVRIKSILEERVKDWKKAPNKKKMKYLGNLQNIRVQTITESQGSEFGIVILSTVRTQPVNEIENREVVQADRQWIREKLGFLTDPHQMCVGITRSKYGLIVVGNSVLLSYDHLWEQLVHHYKENRCFVKDHM